MNLLKPPPSSKNDLNRDSYSSLRFRDFRFLLIGAFLTMFARQMITVAIGWELYERTGSAFLLGGIGLAQVIPLIVLFLPAGYISDRYNRCGVETISANAASTRTPTPRRTERVAATYWRASASE